MSLKVVASITFLVLAFSSALGCGGHSSSSSTPVAGSLTLGEVRTCLKSKGAQIDKRMPTLDLNSKAMFALMPNGTTIGVVFSPNAAVANAAVKQFETQGGYQVSKAPSDPNVILELQIPVDAADKRLVSKCLSASS